MSAQGFRVQQIAQAVHLHEEYIRQLLRQFNRDVLVILKKKPRSGQPLVFTEEERAVIAEYALCPSRALDQAFSRWPLEKRQRFLLHRSINLRSIRRSVVKGD